MFAAILGKLAAGADLSQQEAADAIDAVMQGDVPAGQIALLLTLLHEKRETVAEIAGAASAMRRHMTPIRTSRTGVIDTCGTGGIGSDKFNISTTAALVTAAAGVPVAKHGNRRVTSRSGSADVLTVLGVNVQADAARVGACLDELGICFCFAPLLHGAMKNVVPVRQQLGFRTIFNLLGPLTNPARAEFQLLGVGKPELRPLLAAALDLLGTRRALVVSGADGLGEMTLAAATRISRAGVDWPEDGTSPPQDFEWTPADFGLATASLDSLQVDGPEQSAALIRRVLAGEHGPPRDIVVLNAAAALFTAGRAGSPRVGAAQAAAAIDSGAARQLLDRLVQFTN